MRDHVTNHAVIRYIERVLGLPVDEWLTDKRHLSEDRRAMFCCHKADLPARLVREMVLCAPVRAAVACGFQQVVVRFEGFAYVIREGRVVTILTERMRDEKIGLLDKLKDQSRSEMRRQMARNGRRAKGKNKNRDRRRLAEVE